MLTNLKQSFNDQIWGRGQFTAAKIRKAGGIFFGRGKDMTFREENVFHDTHRSGEVIHTSRGATYLVHKDGSYRHVDRKSVINVPKSNLKHSCPTSGVPVYYQEKP